MRVPVGDFTSDDARLLRLENGVDVALGVPWTAAWKAARTGPWTAASPSGSNGGDRSASS